MKSAELVERWDRQQAAYIADREVLFGVMLDALELAVGTDFTAVDLACGPGSLSGRILDRFPDARVVALDHDPMLLELAREHLAGHGDRVRFAGRDATPPTTVQFQLAALRQAGFAESGTLWQLFDDYVVYGAA
ncbi:class I SAM-dependent methyltransferase [Rhodococcus sp. NPDC003318]|uniref:class I SAM-dependent methyltransferase n=1 Tax=Rhodococcus sp. NPDC003318 TaxID=3364503 RepID=UPI00367F2734